MNINSVILHQLYTNEHRFTHTIPNDPHFARNPTAKNRTFVLLLGTLSRKVRSSEGVHRARPSGKLLHSELENHHF